MTDRSSMMKDSLASLCEGSRFKTLAMARSWPSSKWCRTKRGWLAIFRRFISIPTPDSFCLAANFFFPAAIWNVVESKKPCDQEFKFASEFFGFAKSYSKVRQWDRKFINSTTELNSTLSNSGVEFWNLDVEFWNSNSTSKFQIRHLNSTESNLAPLSNL